MSLYSVPDDRGCSADDYHAAPGLSEYCGGSSVTCDAVGGASAISIRTMYRMDPVGVITIAEPFPRADNGTDDTLVPL